MFRIVPSRMSIGRPSIVNTPRSSVSAANNRSPRCMTTLVPATPNDASVRWVLSWIIIPSIRPTTVVVARDNRKSCANGADPTVTSAVTVAWPRAVTCRV